MTRLLENEDLQRMVSYSFGDQSGVLGEVPNAYMKEANVGNVEFRKKCAEIEIAYKDTMTLFIDNIRLYRRPIEYSDWQHLKPISSADRIWLDQFGDEDLLSLLGEHPYTGLKFHIFTAFEDTPLDKYIWDKIPDNVLSINATNAVVFGYKVRPFPHGIERKMYEGYNHHEILEDQMTLLPLDIKYATKQLLICHRDDTGARGDIKGFFRDKNWATIAPHLEYPSYLKAIKDHKFVLCPSGNGIESARNWETLYMRRVPIFKRHQYLEEMFKDFPALFVGEFSEVTEELLERNEHLYQEALNMDMEKLDLDYWFKKSTNGL